MQNKINRIKPRKNVKCLGFPSIQNYISTFQQHPIIEDTRPLDKSFATLNQFKINTPPPIKNLSFDDFMKDVNNGNVDKVTFLEGKTEIKVLKRNGELDEVIVPKKQQIFYRNLR